MTRLKPEPLSSVRSLEELLAIDRAIKAEAANRYAELAEQMRGIGNETVAGIFQRLSHDELESTAPLELQARERLGHAPSPTTVRWALPETFDKDAASAMTSSRIVTPYRALSLGVRNAEQTFVLWSYLAAQTEAPDVRRAAESMARQQLEYVASLRRERRRAFHAGHLSAGQLREVPGDIDNGTAVLEKRMADMLRQLAKAANETASTRALQLAEEAESMARTPVAARAPPTSSALKSTVDHLALAEVLVERYLEAAEHPHNETAMTQAQSLAAQAINRLAWLRHFAQ